VSIICNGGCRIPIEFRKSKEEASKLLDYIKDNSLKIRNNDIYTLASWVGYNIGDYSPDDMFSEIESIEYNGTEVTYDLSINNGNSYVANGIVCHNTINLPTETTVEEIGEIYKYAYQKNLKGITVYRDGAKNNQPVTFKKEDKVVLSKEFNRPNRLNAEVIKLDTGNGTMYVTISSIEGKPVELFVSMGKSGQVMNTLCESLGRMVSISLQNGVPVKSIVKTLQGINSDSPVWVRLEDTDKKPSQILSIPDGIAQILDRFYGDCFYNGGDPNKKCPKCGGTVMMIEGCMTCNCGYSKCG